MNNSFNQISITHSLGVVPSYSSSFDDEISFYPQSVSSSRRLQKVFHYDRHHLCPSEVTSLDLAEHALQLLFSRSDLTPNCIDALIFVTQTPDYPIPGNSSILHGLFPFSENCFVSDLNDGCAGFIRAFCQAAALIKSFNLANVLIVTADCLSHRISRHDRNSYPLVGDAASAVVLSRDEANLSDTFIDLRQNGSAWNSIFIPDGGARNPATNLSSVLSPDEQGNLRAPVHLTMNGQQVFEFTQTVIPEYLSSYAASRNMLVADFDKIYLHQPNLFILDKLAKKFGLTEAKMPTFVASRYGNSSSCTIPLLLAGDDMPSNARANILMSGFGIGLTWGLIHCNLTRLLSHGIFQYG
jgi:3-oxoacyl-[acyl-carrier-protein] synthase-3